jgi:hypothetical protein
MANMFDFCSNAAADGAWTRRTDKEGENEKPNDETKL